MTDYDMRGTLFRNDKQGNPKRPDLRGPATIHGEELQMSAWVNADPQSGEKRIKVVFEPRQPTKSVVSDPIDDLI